MAIYDCFTFYNEYELLEWRLKILYDAVDVFVVVEGNRTFQNKPKEFNFLQHEELFAPYKDKIRYVPITEDMPYTDDWSIEIFQRNYIKKALVDCKPDDIIILSDVDEIVDPRILGQIADNSGDVHCFVTFGYVGERVGLRGLSRNLRCFLRAIPALGKRKSLRDFLGDSPVVCVQDMYDFFINYKRKSNWCGSILVQYDQIQEMQELRRKRNVYPMVRGGWHFSAMGGIRMIRNKIMSTSDGIKNPIHGLSPEEQESVIEEALSRGHIWWRDEYLDILTLERLAIPHIAWFIEKYPHMYRSPA